MNWLFEIESLRREHETLKKRIADCDKSLKDAKVFTAKFLSICNKHGVKCVSIGTPTDRIESAKNWSHGHSKNIFADDRGKDGWPAIWRIVEEAGIGGGCGNAGQHSANCTRLVDGVYELKNGTWRQVK